MRKRKGSILVLTMFVSAVLLLFGGVMLQLTLGNIKMIEKQSGSDRSYWIAIAGINQQIHDLRQYFFEKQMDYVEKEYGGGTYKVGTATLIGQGVHRSLIAALGEYNESKKSVYAQISMNTNTDYLFFAEDFCRNFRAPQSSSVPRFIGPVHVNGDAIVGHAGDNTIFLKSDSDYGPVLSISGTLYNSNSSYSGFAGVFWTAFGEGVINNPYLYKFDDSKIPQSYSTVYYSAKGGGVGHLWPGDFNSWPSSYDKPVPYSDEQYPTAATHTGPDNAEYSYPLVQDKSNGGTKIKVPTVAEINTDYFRKSIDANWYIEDFGWSNIASKVINITNETVPRMNGVHMGRPTVKLGVINFGSGTGFDIAFERDRDPHYVKYINFRNTECWSNDDDFWWQPDRYVNARHVLPWVSEDPLKSYTVDYVNNKVSFKYDTGGTKWKGIEWNGFYFWRDPSGGKWRGRRITWQIGTGTGSGSPAAPVANQSFALYPANTKYQACPNLLPQTAVSVAAGDPDAEEVLVNGVVWSRAPGNSLTGVGNTNVYTIDFAAGTINFGDYDPDTGLGDGARVPIGQTVVASYCHDFKTPIEVWVHAMVKTIKIDLDKITEDNCPRDPNYPDDKVKYGVIYSKVPLVVRGVPKVPVTIVCEDDVYVGPINSPALQDQYDLDVTKPTRDYTYDETACPVGIISKKVLYLDMTYAPLTKTTDKLYVNTFNGPTGAVKHIGLKKVSLFYPTLYPSLGMTWNNNWNSEQNRYENLLALSMIGGNGTTNKASIGTLASNFEPGLARWCTEVGLVGSIYNTTYHAPILAWQQTSQGANSSFQGAINAVYPSTFRFWEKDKPLTSGPPPHMPLDIKNESFRSGNITSTEAFFDELNNIILTDIPYSADLSKSINELLSTLE